MSIKVQMNVSDILARRGLGTSNGARKVLASRVIALSDPYIPLGDTGDLKNTHYTSPDAKYIKYTQKYAAAQWQGYIKRNGKVITFKNYSNNFGGLRGPKWTDRMKQARGRELVRAVADYVGGKAR